MLELSTILKIVVVIMGIYLKIVQNQPELDTVIIVSVWYLNQNLISKLIINNLHYFYKGVL